jgi:hypothetical protein
MYTVLPNDSSINRALYLGDAHHAIPSNLGLLSAAEEVGMRGPQLFGWFQFRNLIAAAGLAIALVVRVQAAPQAGPTELLIDAARQALIDGRIEDSPLAGSATGTIPFREAPHQGALLIGFDVGVGKVQNKLEVITGIWPIYRTAEGDAQSRAYGMFPSADPRAKPRKPTGMVARQIVRLHARAGYAVGAIRLRTGPRIHALSVTFCRIAERSLNAEQSYHSEWVGDLRGGAQEESLESGGAPALGVYGNLEESQVVGLGLIFLKPLAPASVDTSPAETDTITGAAELQGLLVFFLPTSLVPPLLTLLFLYAWKRATNQQPQELEQPLMDEEPSAAEGPPPSAPEAPMRGAEHPQGAAAICAEVVEPVAAAWKLAEVDEWQARSACTDVSIPPKKPTVRQFPWVYCCQSNGNQLIVFGLALLGLFGGGGLFLLMVADPFDLPVSPKAVVVGLLCGISLSVLVVGIHGRRIDLDVFPRGVVVRRGWLRTNVKWDQFAMVRGLVPIIVNELHVHVLGPLQLKFRDGSMLTLLPEIQDLHELAELLMEKVVNQLALEALETVRRGERLKFGPFQVDRIGLAKGTQMVEWRHLMPVALEPGVADFSLLLFRWGSTEPWCRFPLRDVPNVSVMLAVARKMREEEGTDRSY